jgi:peroxiredoxin
MPGAFIIDRTGRIAYAHYARHAGDHAPEAEIIAAVRALHRLPSPPVGMAAHTED